VSRDCHSPVPEIDDRTERPPTPVGDHPTRDLGSDSLPGRSGDVRERPGLDNSARAYYLGDRSFLLRESEVATLVDIGKFRVIPPNDLAQFAYAGDTKRANRDLRHLIEQELVAMKSLERIGKHLERLLVLTKKGKRLLLEAGRLPDGQAVYHGLVKPREAQHDAALYRLYQRESARIESAGGRPLRVALDYELRRNLHRELARLGDEAQTREARERVAEMQGLVLVNDKVQVPDLRLEYETADHERRHVDLELATRNYRPRALAQKGQAGFSIYAPREDAARLQRIFDASELPARVFAL
jgi:hypothetical protein